MSDSDFTAISSPTGFRPASVSSADDVCFKPKYQEHIEPEIADASNGDEEWHDKIKEAYDAGLVHGREEALKQVELSRQQQDKLADALSGLRCADRKKLDILFWQSVSSLLKKTIGETQINEALLQERCSAVLTLINKQMGEPKLHIAPSDYTAACEFPCDIEIIPDPELSSGSVRLVHAHGVVDAGSSLLLSAIENAIESAGQSIC